MGKAGSSRSRSPEREISSPPPTTSSSSKRKSRRTEGPRREDHPEERSESARKAAKARCGKKRRHSRQVDTWGSSPATCWQKGWPTALSRGGDSSRGSWVPSQEVLLFLLYRKRPGQDEDDEEENAARLGVSGPRPARPRGSVGVLG